MVLLGFFETITEADLTVFHLLTSETSGLVPENRKHISWHITRKQKSASIHPGSALDGWS